MIFAAGVFFHGAGGAAGLDGVGVVAVEVGAGGADARVFPVVGVVNFWLTGGHFGIFHSVLWVWFAYFEKSAQGWCLPAWL